MKTNFPWASGPKEILEHGLSLLSKGGDINRRLALLSIDNAVELTIKTYLGLPIRISGLDISRKEFDEVKESFPKLLDLLERKSKEKIAGIDLGEIEWFHRLRNQLYHDGNGLTIEESKVQIYSELAKLLFERLFDEKLIIEEKGFDLLGRFLNSWIEFEKITPFVVKKVAIHVEKTMGIKDPGIALGELMILGYLSKSEVDKILEIRKIRNEIVHGKVDFNDILSISLVNDLELINKKLQNI